MSVVINGTTGITTATAAAPAFSAYQSSAQTLSSGVFTKIQFQTKDFDTNSNFDNATNYRFTPTVAGYYQVSGGGLISLATAQEFIIQIYKNGSVAKQLQDTVSVINRGSYGSALIYLNGSTDYIELYAYLNAAGTFTVGSTNTYFQAFMARSA